MVSNFFNPRFPELQFYGNKTILLLSQYYKTLSLSFWLLFFLKKTVAYFKF